MACKWQAPAERAFGHLCFKAFESSLKAFESKSGFVTASDGKGLLCLGGLDTEQYIQAVSKNGGAICVAVLFLPGHSDSCYC